MFGFDFGMYEVIFEVYMGDQLTSRQKMQALKEMLMLTFIDTVNKIKNDKRPMKVKMIRQEVVYDKTEKKQKTMENYVEFRNNAMDDI